MGEELETLKAANEQMRISAKELEEADTLIDSLEEELTELAATSIAQRKLLEVRLTRIKYLEQLFGSLDQLVSDSGIRRET